MHSCCTKSCAGLRKCFYSKKIIYKDSGKVLFSLRVYCIKFNITLLSYTNRCETLDTLLFYSDPRGADLECRYAAIDAIGNVLSLVATPACLETLTAFKGGPRSTPSVGDAASGQSVGSSVITSSTSELDCAFEMDGEAVVVDRENGQLLPGQLDDAACRAVHKRIRSEMLLELHARAVAVLSENLKAAIAMICSSGSGVVLLDASNPKTRLLISSLRTLSQALFTAQPYSPPALAAAALVAPPSYVLPPNFATPHFQQNLQSLVQATEVSLRLRQS